MSTGTTIEKRLPSPKGFHLHITHAAALDPQEINIETKALFDWLEKHQPQDREKWSEAKAALQLKDIPVAWEILKDVQLFFSGKEEQHAAPLLGWQLCFTLQLAFQKWKRFQFPHKEIFNPPVQDLEEAESRCREALLLTLSFYPFLKNQKTCPAENETHRHCLAYTLLSCLHSDTPTLESDLQRLKTIAYTNRITPHSTTPASERTGILTQSILLLSYGGPISKTEWSRPDSTSIKNLLEYVYSNSEGRISHLIPKETLSIHHALQRNKLL